MGRSTMSHGPDASRSTQWCRIGYVAGIPVLTAGGVSLLVAGRHRDRSAQMPSGGPWSPFASAPTGVGRRAFSGTRGAVRETDPVDPDAGLVELTLNRRTPAGRTGIHARRDIAHDRAVR